MGEALRAWDLVNVNSVYLFVLILVFCCLLPLWNKLHVEDPELLFQKNFWKSHFNQYASNFWFSGVGFGVFFFLGFVVFFLEKVLRKCYVDNAFLA